MDFSRLPVGINPPWDINVVVEIPYNSEPVKYEVHKEAGVMYVDRFLHTAMRYPFNYGFVPHTLAGDGDPVDIGVVGRTPVIPGAVIRCRPIGILLMEDEGGPDEKLLSVPVKQIHPFYDDVHNYSDLPGAQIDQFTHFYAHYKDLEHDKWVKIIRWGDADEAAQRILDGIAAAEEYTRGHPGKIV